MEEFIKGIEAAISHSGGKIKRKLAHVMFVGPPGSGKSSLMDRLLGRLRKKFSVSTDVCDSIVIIDINVANPSTFSSATVADSHNTWEETECDASFLRHMREESTLPVSSSPKNDYHVEAQLAQLENSDESKGSKASSLAESSFSNQSLSHLDSTEHSRAEVLKTAITELSVGKIKATHFKKSIIQSVIKKYGFKKFKQHLEKTCSLYLRDTGGQVEFQEMLPLLISGPSLFIFVFRADLDLKSKFKVQYRKSPGNSFNSYISSITTEEALLQSLASVYAMDTSSEDVVKSHQSLVFIVDTHTDKLGSEREAKISSLNQHLDFIIRSNGFNHLVQYADEHKGHVMFAIDNTSEREESFQLVRSKVNSLVKNRTEFSIEYPVSYLLFCLDLQNVKESILTLEECRKLAASHGIMGEQVLHLLRFLHLRIGLVQHYDVEGLRHLIIIEPQVLFKKTTDLIVITFSSGSLFPGEVTDLEKRGIISAGTLSNLEYFSDNISAKEFLHLLVHLRITAPFHVAGDQEERYFIPCVLNHVPELMAKEESETDIAPLCVKFKCNHCPKGIYGLLITHLMRPERNDQNTTFTLLDGKIFKDQVSFEVQSVGVLDEVVLKLCISHLEINLYPDLSDDRDITVKEVCSNVRDTIEKSILVSLKDLHYDREKVGPVICFKCEHCSELHPVMKGKKHHKMNCRKSRKTNRIPPSGRCWYNEDSGIMGYTSNHQESITVQYSTPPKRSKSSSGTKTVPTEAGSLDKRSSSATGFVNKTPLKLTLLLKELLPLAGKWHNIGTLLCIPEGKLDVIKQNNFYQVEECLREMISVWLNMADPEPTWEGLVEAMEVIDPKKAQDIKSKYLSQ